MQLNIAKLTSARLSERTISSGILENPDDPVMGKILYVIDIPLPLIVGEPVEKTILDVLKSEYFSTEKRLPIYQFEDSIRQVNAALSEIAENNNNEWIGHIHASLALWAGDEIFVTYAGRAVAYLARKDNLISIIDQTSPDRRVLVHKTFANMITGQLSHDDVIILGNNELSRHFSPQFLCQTVSETPSHTVNRMTQAMHRLNLKFVTAIIAKLTQESHENDDNGLITTQIDESQLALDIGIPVNINSHNKKMPIISSDIINKKLSQTKEFIKKHLDKFHRGAKIAIKTASNPKQPDIHYDSTETEHGSTKIAPPSHQRSTSLKVNNNINRITKQFKRIIIYCWNKILRAPRKTILALVIILILIIGFTSYIQVKNNQSTISISDDSLNTKISEITTLYQSALAVSNNQPEAARSSLISATELLKTITGSSKQRENISTLTNQVETLLNQINRASIVNTNQKERVADGTDHFIVIGQYLFSSQLNKNSVYRQILGRTESPVEVVQLPAQSTLISMIYREKERQITYATSNGKLFNYQTDGKNSNTELIAPTNSTWPEAQSIAWYQNNLYILEKNTGIIWKFLSSDGINFSSKQQYIVDQNLVKTGSLSIATDGFVYLLYQDGSIAKMSKGKNQTFNKLILPPPTNTLNTPFNVYTDDVTNSVFLIEQNRIIEMTKDGQYVHQYILPTSTIKATYISPKVKKAWILYDNFVDDTQL